jgi:protein-tyrosine phosphatase
MSEERTAAALKGFIDFHSHLMPGVDDGAGDVAQSLEALRAFAAQGASACITTPHFDGSLTRMPGQLDLRLAALDAGWAKLQAAQAATPGLPRIERGVELMLDDPDPDLSDARLRLAGGPFVLVEFPAMQLPPNAEWALHNIRRQGWRPILAHPERYRNHDSRLTVLSRCRAAGAHLQVNSGSFLGQHGDRARAMANGLLALGWIDYLASDHHARGEPSTERAASLLVRRGAERQVQRLTAENPARILAGEGPLPVAPLSETARPWWARLLARVAGSD